MAEATTSSTSTSTTSSTPAKSQQYIRSFSDHDKLEPDALRGNEQLIKDLGIQDDDADMRKKFEEKK